MKANTAFGRVFRPLLAATLAATTTLALPMPERLHRQVEAQGLRLTYDVTQSFGAGRQVLLHVSLENLRDEAVFLPGGAAENGLSFHLVDPQGRRLLDAGAPGSVTDEVFTLSPGGSLRSVVDLTRRPLLRLETEGEARSTTLHGLADPRLAFHGYFDLVLEQQVLDGSPLRGPALRVFTNPLAVLALFPGAEAARPSARGARARALFARIDPPSLLPVPGPGGPTTPGLDHVPGQLLVTIAEGVTLDDARRLLEGAGFPVLQESLFSRLRILVVGTEVGVERDAARTLRALDGVVAAEVNGVVQLF